MATHTTLTGLFDDIADAIRAKTGDTDNIIADEFPDAIANIPSGTATIDPIMIVENGTYTATGGVDGYSPVTVNVPVPPMYRSTTITDDTIALTTSFTAAIPDAVTVIDDKALTYFYAGTNITAFNLNNVTEVKPRGMAYTFNTCRLLTNFTAPNLQIVHSRGMEYCFAAVSGSLGTQALTTISFPALETIESSAFFGAFGGCSDLTSISFPVLAEITDDDTTGIPTAHFADAFQYTNRLTSLTFPALSYIRGNRVFYEAFTGSGIQTISFPELETIVDSTELTFNHMLTGVTGCTVHFPAALESTIGQWQDVVDGFGGTNTTVLFDL